MKPPVTSTDAVHAGEPQVRFARALAAPIALTATYTFSSSEELDQYMRGEHPDPDREEYGRYGNPTVREVERRLALLDGADDALLFASGMAAITTTILTMVKGGDHVVLFRDVYRRTRQFLTGTLGRLGVEHTLVEPTSIEGLRAAIGPKTRLVITESPTNPYLRCVDLARLAEICRAAKVRSVVDATFATPCNARPIEHGVDLVVHSATKYLAGHNDVLAGVVSGSEALISLVRDMRGVLGGVCDPHAAWMVGRGLKTLALRVARQNETAVAVARALEQHPAVLRVHHPWLPSHPDHAVARAQMAGGGGVVSFVVRGGREGAKRVVDGFRLATIAPSLGGVESLVEQPALMSYYELDDAALAEMGIEPGLIRLSVGIEETSDVIEDVHQALLRAPKTTPP